MVKEKISKFKYIMILYTAHNPEFDIVNQLSDPFNHSLLDEIDYDIKYKLFTNAYNWLFEKLNTKHIIWCSPVPIDWLRNKIEYKVWILDVPKNDIVTTLHRSVWDAILSNIIPPNTESDLLLKWHDDADKLYPNDFKKSNEYLTKLEHEYISTHNIDEEKMKVFISSDNAINDDGDYNDVLIPSPAKSEWVVEVQHVCGVEYD